MPPALRFQQPRWLHPLRRIFGCVSPVEAQCHLHCPSLTQLRQDGDGRDRPVRGPASTRAPVLVVLDGGPFPPLAALDGLQFSSERSGPTSPFIDEETACRGACLGVAVGKETQAAGSGLGSVLCAPQSILRAPLGRTLTCTSAPEARETPGKVPGSHLQWCICGT